MSFDLDTTDYKMTHQRIETRKCYDFSYASSLIAMLMTMLMIMLKLE